METKYTDKPEELEKLISEYLGDVDREYPGQWDLPNTEKIIQQLANDVERYTIRDLLITDPVTRSCPMAIWYKDGKIEVSISLRGGGHISSKEIDVKELIAEAELPTNEGWTHRNLNAWRIEN